MVGGFVYILKCSNGSYYTGSTRNLNARLEKHQKGIATNFTNKHRPVKLVYFEEYDRIAKAYEREKQIQGWTRAKKEALITGASEELKRLATCKNDTHFKNN